MNANELRAEVMKPVETSNKKRARFVDFIDYISEKVINSLASEEQGKRRVIAWLYKHFIPRMNQKTFDANIVEATTKIIEEAMLIRYEFGPPLDIPTERGYYWIIPHAEGCEKFILWFEPSIGFVTDEGIFTLQVEYHSFVPVIEP